MEEAATGPPQVASGEKTVAAADGVSLTSPDSSGTNEEVFKYDESRKLGTVSAMFLILNKMIGTGSKSSPQASALCGGFSNRNMCASFLNTIERL